MGSSMPLQHNAFHTQNRVDATRLEVAIVDVTKVSVASFDGTFELVVTELANELAAELDAECTGRGSKLIFVFGKNTTKSYFKKEMN